jgi:hypothetical protein
MDPSTQTKKLVGLFAKATVENEMIEADQQATISKLRQNLRLKVNYDESKIDRLIEFERERTPGAGEEMLLRAPIERFERDNR